MNTDDQSSFLVIECASKASKEDADYRRNTEKRLDEIAIAFSIKKPENRWYRVTYPDIIGKLGAPEVTDEIHTALRHIAEDINRRGGATIVLIAHADCVCVKTESPLVHLGRAALRIDLMLGQLMNDTDPKIKWIIHGIIAIHRSLQNQTPAVAHVFGLNELRMVSGGNVNLVTVPDVEVILDDVGLEKFDSDEVDSIHINSSGHIPHSPSTGSFTRKLPNTSRSSSETKTRETPLAKILKRVSKQRHL